MEIQNHGERVYSIFLKPESPAPSFLPGQYLNLALDEYGARRHLAGEPLFFHRQRLGRAQPAAHHLCRQRPILRPAWKRRCDLGSPVWVKMPYGEFITDPAQDACLLAGGTGVTAFTAFLAGLSAVYPHHIDLFYGARRPGQLIYRPLVQAAAQRCPGLQVHYFAEQDFAGTDCLPGRIEAETVFRSVPEPLSLTYYLAGPPGMVHALTIGLIAARTGPQADRGRVMGVRIQRTIIQEPGFSKGKIGSSRVCRKEN